MLDPWASPEPLVAVNPLLQVPTLVLDDGLALAGSDTNLGTLESVYPEAALLPGDAAALVRALAVAGLAQGLIECSVQIVLERRRAPEQQDAATIERRRAAIGRVLDRLATRFDRSADRFHLDGIGLACALAYLDFRLPDQPWRGAHPELAAWQDWANGRASLRASAPPA